MHYSPEELTTLKIRFGARPCIHKSVVFFNPENLVLGDDVRIDCFGVLSVGPEGIRMGNNVHLGASVFLFGGGGKIHLEDFVGLSSRVSIYTATDDYMEGFMTNPTVPDPFRKVKAGPVVLKKHVLVGSGSVLMPDITLGVGAAVGALSVVSSSVKEFTVVGGNPPRFIGERGQKLLDLEKEFLKTANR